MKDFDFRDDRIDFPGLVPAFGLAFGLKRRQRLADGGDAGHIVGNLAMDLDLKVPVALIDQNLGLFGHLFRFLDGKDAQDRKRTPDHPAKEPVHGYVEGAGVKIEQGV